MSTNRRYGKLERLVKWDRITEVNNMLMSGVAPRKVAVWCCDHGFDISDNKMYEYKQLLSTAIGKQITVDRMLGLSKPRQNPIMSQVMMETDTKNLVKNEIEVIDVMIQRGYSLMKLPTTEIKASDILKAIELKNKITSGAHGGLTNYGLDQLRELEKAKMEAMVEVVSKYLQPEQTEELYDAIAVAERDFYKNHAPEMLEEYDQMVQEELDDLNSDGLLGLDEESLTSSLAPEDVIDLVDPDDTRPFIPYCKRCKSIVPSVKNEGEWSVVPTQCPRCGTPVTLVERD